MKGVDEIVRVVEELKNPCLQLRPEESLARETNAKSDRSIREDHDEYQPHNAH